MSTDFKDIMLKRTDEELIKIVTVDRDGYQPLAVIAAEEEIKNRNMSATRIEEIQSELNIKIEEKKKRPTVITVICVLIFLSAVVIIPDIFSDYIGEFENWVPLYSGLSCIICIVSIVGLWQMKKWGAYTYAGFVGFKQIFFIVMGEWNIMALIVPAVVVGISLTYIKNMD